MTENIRAIPPEKRVDVILTNPPFGGREGKHIQQNFPIKSNATELLALQYVMRRLKPQGRCGMVLPEGVLFRGDAFARVKKELLEDYDLHTIVSLPPGTFANVAASGQGPKTNLIFFERGRPTKEIWYYEHTPPPGQKYTKAKPIKDEHLEDCFEKRQNREVSESSWTVTVEEIIKRNYDLTAKNPNKAELTNYRSPDKIVSRVLQKENEIARIIKEVKKILK